MPTREELMQAADREILAFEEWFVAKGAEPLAKFEKAIIKTFILARASNSFTVSLGQKESSTDVDIVSPYVSP